MNERDTIPGAQKLAQFKETRMENCYIDKHGHLQHGPMTCKEAGAIGGRATGPNKRRTRAHYRRASKIRWARWKTAKQEEQSK